MTHTGDIKGIDAGLEETLLELNHELKTPHAIEGAFGRHLQTTVRIVEAARESLKHAQALLHQEEGGFCGTCRFRDVEGLCTNPKLAEGSYDTDALSDEEKADMLLYSYREGSYDTDALSDEEKADMLLYSYREGGAFWVGKNFGCVHHDYK